MTIRKIFPVVFSCLFFSATCLAQNNQAVKNYLGISSINFNNVAYDLSWSSHPTDTYYKHEYLPKGSDVEKFNSMILLEVVTGDVMIKDLVGAKMEELKKMKVSNPVINYEVFNNSKTGEYLLDFILSASSQDGKSMVVLERNVYRYKSFTDKSGIKAVLLFGVSTRKYGNAIDAFLASLKTIKKDMVNKVAQFNIPEISTKN